MAMFYIYIYIYACVYTWSWLCHGFYFTVMLCTTTGPYGRLMLEVVYGEILLSLHRGSIGDDSSERVVGVSAWCIVHVWHTRINTSVGLIYIIFGFLNTKTYVYVCILISKSICIKEHWWSLISWPNEVQRMFLTTHEFYIWVLLKNHRLLTTSWVLFKLLCFILLLLLLLSCFI